MFDINHKTQPSSEPVTTSEAKVKLGITYSDDDTLIGNFITTARQQVEKYCGIAIGSQTKELWFDACSDEEYAIPYPPIISVDTVTLKTDLATYTAKTLGTDYDIDGTINKTFRPFTCGRWKLAFTCGYTTIPQGIKDAVLTQTVHLYEHRGDEANQGLCQMAMEKAQQYKNYSWQ